MRIVVEFLLACFLRTVLWFRYKIEVKGLDKLTPENLSRKGGTLFLPNHPTVFVDATAISAALWPKFRLRPLIVEYMYYLPMVHSVMKMIDALPVPNFAESSNSIKRKKNDQIIAEVCKGLQEGQNFLIFPSGRVKHTAYEAIDGASAVHTIVQNTPEANIVLVRVKGLWGSSFSRALTGQTPPMFATALQGAKKILKNLLFFTPRRKIIVEFEPVPAGFPIHAGRLEFNKYLEKWYNRPDGLTPQSGQEPGDSLVLVSYSMWKKELPEVWSPKKLVDENVELSTIPENIRSSVINKLAELTETPASQITAQMSLTTDLGMDSLDIAEVVAFLHDEFDVSNVSPNDLNSVIRIMAIAAKQVEAEGVKEVEEHNLSQWLKPRAHERVYMAVGNTIPEVFLNNCTRMGSTTACADGRTGIVSYSQLKLRTLILAEYIRHLPGEYIGILLPASVTASMTILACQLAGKIPLMVNWTVGPRHLEAVTSLSKVQVVLSSWAFIDRLQNVDFNGLEERMIMLEDVRRSLGLKDKLKAFWRSKKSTSSLLKTFQIENLSKDRPAVLLFTSGTESMPKGVLLSHENILSNQRATLEAIELYSDDVVFGILPPFHSFGFTITGLTSLLAGVRVAYSPDPTDGKKLADGFEKWKITVLCGAPSFVKGLIKAARPEQLRTMRLCVTGAEKLPNDLILAMQQIKLDHCLYEGYGITECSPVLTFTRIGEPRQGVGKPLPNVSLCVVNFETHQPVPVGQQGLILARGPNIFSGYLNPGLSSPFITVEGKNWYNTGDLGYLDTTGTLFLSGRLKRFIKVGGEMISLAAIEDALIHSFSKKQHTQEEEGPLLAISGKENPGEKPMISLFCRFPVTLEEANRILREAGFSNLVKITKTVELTEIPLMGSGKVNYRKLDEILN